MASMMTLRSYIWGLRCHSQITFNQFACGNQANKTSVMLCHTMVPSSDGVSMRTMSNRRFCHKPLCQLSIRLRVSQLIEISSVCSSLVAHSVQDFETVRLSPTSGARKNKWWFFFLNRNGCMQRGQRWRHVFPWSRCLPHSRNSITQ